MAQSQLTALAITKNPNIIDDLRYVFARWVNPVQLLSVSSLNEISTKISQALDIILVDPLLILQRDQRAFFQELRNILGSVPILYLLPIDTRDYRNAAVESGANGIVAIENLATDLLPLVRSQVSKSTVLGRIEDQIQGTAQHTSPAGEAAYLATILEERSDRAVEKLTQDTTPLPHTETNVSNRITEINPDKHIFLRNLTVDASSRIRSHDVRTYRTACNHDCGFHYCGLRVTIRDQRITKIEPGDFPDTRYRSICLKGMSYAQIVSHPDRLMHPLKRKGPRGSGSWEQISWDQAFTEIAQKIKQISAEFNPEAMMFLTSKGQASVLNGYFGVYLRLASLLGASALNPQALGMDTGLPSGIEDTFGSGSGFLVNAFEDLHNSKVIVIWGSNPVHSWMPWWSFFLEAKNQGAQIITIDPRCSSTAAKSDIWLSVRPGTDLILAYGMIRLIIDKGWLDRQFVLQHTVGPFLVRDDNGQYLRVSDIHEPALQSEYLVWDQDIQGVVSPGESKNPAIQGQYEINGISCRPAFDLLCQYIATYTPDYVAEATGLTVEQIIELTHTYATTKPARIFTGFGVERWLHGSTFGRLIAILGALTGNIGIEGGGAGVSGFFEIPLHLSEFVHPNDQHFKPVNPADLPEYIVSGNPYPIKGVMVAFCNWFNQFTDLNYTMQKILPNLDLLVVSELFMTETAQWADYVLPAATIFEREDMVRGPGPYIQYQPRILPTPGDCRADLDIAAGIGEQFGVGDYFSASPSTYLRQELEAIEPGLNPDAFTTLQEQGWFLRPVNNAKFIPHSDLKFDTPTGCIEFYVERLLPYGRALPIFQSPAEAFRENKLASMYPLTFIMVHDHYRVNSFFGRVNGLRELDPEPYASINPKTAQERRIKDGDWIKIYNARGYVVLRSQITNSVPVETIYLSAGWHANSYRAGHPQTLTHRRMDHTNALGASMIFSDILVEVCLVEDN